jgi:small GTP-binding protein
MLYLRVNSMKFKFVFIGDPGGGKTAINTKFITQRFEQASSTIGAIFSCRQIHIPERNAQAVINFWDTAGQERFRSIAPIYYRGSSAIILVYDITNLQSFENLLTYWSQQIKHENFMKVFLIGNKTDLLNRQVTTYEAQQFADQNNFDFCEISAKYDNLEPLLKRMVNLVWTQVEDTHLSVDKLKFYGVVVDQIPEKKNWAQCCYLM